MGPSASEDPVPSKVQVRPEHWLVKAATGGVFGVCPVV